jgi:glutaminase
VCSPVQNALSDNKVKDHKEVMNTVADDCNVNTQKLVSETQHQVCQHNKSISCVMTSASSEFEVVAESICTANLYSVTVFIRLSASFFQSFPFLVSSVSVYSTKGPCSTKGNDVVRYVIIKSCMFSVCFYAIITYSKINITQLHLTFELSSLGYLTVQENCVSQSELYLHILLTFFLEGFILL